MKLISYTRKHKLTTAVWLFSFLLMIQSVAMGQITGLKQSDFNRQTKELTILREILSMPNDAQFPDDIDKNTAWLKNAFEKRGFLITIIPSAARPFLFAEKKISASKPTVLFYMHFDGQPVTAKDWKQPSPFQPVLKRREGSEWSAIDWERVSSYDPDWRVFARSASDDKGPIAMFLAAIDRLKDVSGQLAYNVKLILDSEEEKGSPNLPAMVKKHAALLQADRFVIFDGPRHTSNEPTLLFGCRGVAELDLEVFGPRNDLHSGHYGNYAPNPAFELSALLASMKNAQGEVVVEDFYKGIHVSTALKADLLRVPDNKVHINQLIGIANDINPALSYQEGLQRPSLNILSLYAGRPETGPRNIVPAIARAVLDIRLVPESDPAHLEKALRKFITAKGFHIIKGREPTEEERSKYSKLIFLRFTVSSLAFVTEPDSPTGAWLTGCLQRVFNSPVVNIRMAGGTVPIAPFIRELGIPAVLVPTVNPDNNQHAADENLRLGNYFEGITTILEILTTGF